MTSLSVIIPTHNRTAVLKEALRHLAEGSVQPDEVIVIDDASTEPVPRDLMGENPAFSFRLIRFEKNRGASAARNAGIRAAKGDILVLQDDDIFADHHMIRYHQRIHQQHPEKSYGVMGRIYFDPDLCRTPVMHYLEEYGAFTGITKAPDNSPVTTGLISANFSLKRDFIKDERLFDENFPFNRNEDTEFGLRMMEKGLNLRFHIAPSARHHSPLTLDAFFRQLGQGGFSKAYWSEIRPDDSEHCLRLGLAVNRKIHEAEFKEYFRKYIDTFGDKFLSGDISQCSRLEFEELRRFMDTAVPWGHFIALADGWMDIIPGFPGILQKISAAFNSPDSSKKIKYLREASRINRDFFPMAILWGETLTRLEEYSEALRILLPFEKYIWGKLRLAKLNYHLKNFDACFQLLHNVFATTRHKKSVETKQRCQAAELLELLLKTVKNEKWTALIRSHLTEEELTMDRFRGEIPGLMENPEAEGTNIDKRFVDYFRKSSAFGLLNEGMSDLTKTANLPVYRNIKKTKHFF